MQERVTMRDITEKYNAVMKQEDAKRESLFREAGRCKAELERLELECAMCKQRYNSLRRWYEGYSKIGWLEGLVYPLAKTLGEATGLFPSIFGEQGFGSTSLYLTKSKDTDWSREPYLCIKLEPHYKDGRGELCYKICEGSAEFSPLPDTIEEIIPLLRGSLEIPQCKGGLGDA